MAFSDGAVQVSKARPVYVFWAGQAVAAIEVCAAMPPPATTAAPATAHVMYLRFFDCRCPAIPHPCSYVRPARYATVTVRLGNPSP
ncbi:hypothetical protein GCM10010129_55570 [Streptomyces fumigatiscleroticus]|nr:hypothetical protein GCM10010129_55570 [Streptomyces fumigatiscleroticus]